MRQFRRVALVVGFALSLASCGGGGGGNGEADIESEDGAGELDFFAEEMADESADISVDGEASETLTLKGRVLDETGAPVAKAMAVLCGTVEELAVCIQRFAGDDGTFEYTDLLQGYTHLQVMPYAAAAQSGLLYAGISFVTEFPAPPGTYDWGDIVLPIIAETDELVVAEGGTFDLEGLSLELAPGSATFPDLTFAGPVGVVRAAAEQIPVEFGGDAAYAFYPYDTRLSEAATVQIPVDSLTGVWDGIAPVQVFVNSTDDGGLYAVDAVVDGEYLVFEISELTWIVLAFEK
jgi:hypothetical protein